MTMEDLKQLQYLPAMIRTLQGKIQRLREAADVKSPRLDGMPHGSGTCDKLGNLVPEIIDTEKELNYQITALREKQRKLHNWIDDQPPKVQLIVLLRFEDGLSWEEVATQMGTWKATGDSVRIYLKRYMNSLTEDPDAIEKTDCQ